MASRSSNSGTSTSVVEPMELMELHDSSTRISKPPEALSIYGRGLESASVRPETSHELNDTSGVLPSPTTASERIETWRSPAINMYRVPATFWAFTVMGLNDATYGAIIPYLETYYSLQYSIISLIFLSPFVGYTLSAVLSNAVHMKFGRRGIAFLGPFCHLLAYIVIAVHPPYPLLIIAYLVAGFGNGIEDAAFNAWIGVMANANEMLGFLHGFYGVGGAVAPVIATSMITKANLPWYYWYYIMIGLAAVEVLVCTHSFWSATGAEYREQSPRNTGARGSRLKEAVVGQPAARVTWSAAVFLLGYVGVEVALGGWIVSFMLSVRHGAAFASGMVSTGFWLGLTVGRFFLGFVTPRIGEKLAITIYLPITMVLELLFWLVPEFYVSAVAVALQGFFLGPLFPAAVVVCTKLLPTHLHVSAIGFAAAFGGSGGAIFPYAVGAIAQAKGVQVLQPIILALLVAIFFVWLSLPRIGRKRD